MKRKAQPMLSEAGQHALSQYRQSLQQVEDLSPVTIRNYMGDLRQFIAWCECSWDEEQEERFFAPQAVAPSLLARYRDYLQNTLSLKPSTVNRTLMSLKRYFAWTRKTQLVQSDPARPIKFVPKEATPPRHLSDEEEEALVAAVNATGTLPDQAIIMLLLHTGLRAQELCSLTRQQVHLAKRNGTLRVIGKRKKVREVPLNTTARSILNQYLETLSPACLYLFPSEKTQRALTGRALGHLVTKYATQAHVADVSPHDLRHRFGYRMAEAVPLHRLARYHDALYPWNKARPPTRRGENRMDIEKWLHFRRYSEALEACDEALRLSRPVNSLSKLLHTHKLLGQPAPLDNLSAVYLNVMRLREE